MMYPSIYIQMSQARGAWWEQYGYPVDHVISNGVDNWVDTWLSTLNAKDGVIIEMDLEYVTVPSREINVFGCVSGSSSTRNVVEAGSVVGGKSAFYAYTSNAVWKVTDLLIVANKRYKFKYDFKSGLQIMYSNGIEVFRSTSSTNITRDGIMTLFARNYGYGSSWARGGYANVKLYSFKITKQDGEVLADYFPFYVAYKPMPDFAGETEQVGSYVLADNVRRAAPPIRGEPLTSEKQWWEEYGVFADNVVSNGTNNWIDLGVSIQSDLHIDADLTYLTVDKSCNAIGGAYTIEGTAKREIVEGASISYNPSEDKALTYFGYGRGWSVSDVQVYEGIDYKFRYELLAGNQQSYFTLGDREQGPYFWDVLDFWNVEDFWMLGNEEGEFEIPIGTRTDNTTITKDLNMYLFNRNVDNIEPTAGFTHAIWRNVALRKLDGTPLSDLRPFDVTLKDMKDINGRIYPVGSRILLDMVQHRPATLYGDMLQPYKEIYKKLDFIIYPAGGTEPYMELGQWNHYSKIELDFRSTDTSDQDILFGRSGAGTHFIGYASGGNISKNLTGVSSFSVSPDLTNAQKGDGTRRVVTIDYRATDTNTMSYGAYGDPTYTKHRETYGLKLYNNTGLVRDLIPAELLMDYQGYKAGSVGLWDVLNDTFYGSVSASANGTVDDNFESKPIIWWEAIGVRIPYIESTGTQYIDLGVTGDETTEFGVTFALTDTRQQMIAGSRESADKNNLTIVYPNNETDNRINIDYRNNLNNRLATDYQLEVDKFYTAIASPSLLAFGEGVGEDRVLVDDSTPFETVTTLKLFQTDGVTYTTQKMIGKISEAWLYKDGYRAKYVPIQVLSKFTDASGKVWNANQFILVNELVNNEVPVHSGSFDGIDIRPYEPIEGITFNSGDTDTYIDFGQWKDYNRIMLRFLSNDTSEADVFFGRSASSGFMGYADSNLPIMNSVVHGGAEYTIAPELTAEEKGNGDLLTLNITYTSTSEGRLTLGAYSNGDYTKKKSIKNLALFSVDGSVLSLYAVKLVRDYQNYPAGTIGLMHTNSGKFYGPFDLEHPFEEYIVPTDRGLIHWWDASDQRGTIWKPKVGNVTLTTEGSWKDGCLSKSREGVCQSELFDVSFGNGFTVDILWNIEALNSIPYPGSTDIDTQLYTLVDQDDKEYLLHYTSYMKSEGSVHSSAFYSPTLLGGKAYRGIDTYPLGQFVSDVFSCRFDEGFISYFNGEKDMEGSVVNTEPTQVRFALSRLLPVNNNLEALVRSIRIYDIRLLEDEVAHNRAYDEWLLKQPLPVPEWWAEFGTGAAYVQTNGTNNYVDTDVLMQNDLNIEFNFEYLKVDGTSEHLFGGVSGTGDARRIVELGFINGGKLTYAYGDGWVNTDFVPVQDTPYNLRAEFTSGSQVMYVNGVEEHSTTTTVDINQSISMYMLTRNEFGTPATNMATVKIRGAKISKPTGEVLLDYVPIYLDVQEMTDDNGRVYPIGSYVLVDNVTKKVVKLYGDDLTGSLL